VGSTFHASEFRRVWGQVAGFGVQGSGVCLRVWCSRFQVQDFGFRAQDFGFRVQGSGYRVSF